MGDYDAYDGGVSSIMFFPSTGWSPATTTEWPPRFTPLSPQETEAELTWLVHPDAVEGVDYDPGEVTWLWLKTLEEDKEIWREQPGRRQQPLLPSGGPTARPRRPWTGFCRWYLDELSVKSRT